jgi:LysM repeat protein
MRLSSRFVCLALIALAALVSAGCVRDGMQITAEIEEPHFRRGQQMARSAKNQEALEAFLKVIDKRGGDAPESHLEAGRLYLNHIKDPIGAIYHFRRFLELRPNSPQAPMVQQLIETSIKEFARRLPAQPLENQVERLDLLETIERLQTENRAFQQEIASLRQSRAAQVAQPAAQPEPQTFQPRPPQAQPAAQAPTPTAVAAQPVRTPPTPPQTATARRTYVVERGDTLFAISSKVYGNGNRWREIYDANRGVIPNPDSLTVGTQLRIP